MATLWGLAGLWTLLNQMRSDLPRPRTKACICLAYWTHKVHGSAGLAILIVLFVCGCGDIQRSTTVLRHGHIVSCVAFSENGDYIASASLDGVIGLCKSSGGQAAQVFSVAESGLEPPFAMGTSSPMALGVVPIEQGRSVLVAAEGRSGEIRRWTSRGEPKERIWECEMFYAVGVDPAGGCLVAVSPGQEPDVLLVFLSEGNGEVLTVPNRTELALLFAVTANVARKVLILGWSDGKVQVFTIANTVRSCIETENGDYVAAVSCSPDGRRFASGGPEGQVKVWDSESGELITQLRSEVGVGAIAFHPSGRYVAVGGTDGAVRVWNVASAKLEHVLDGRGRPVSALSFSQAGDLLGIGTQDGCVRVRRLPCFEKDDLRSPHFSGSSGISGMR